MMRQFHDIEISTQFIADYEYLPKPIKARVDRRIMDWAIVGELPPSAQAHRAYNYGDNVWILYLTVNKGAWRMLGEIRDRKLILYRVGDHEQITRELRPDNKSSY